MSTQNIYSTQEKEIISEFDQNRKRYIGWVGDIPTPECPHAIIYRNATKELIIQMAKVVDPWNPLWTDDTYGENTRWGGLIAPPFFPHRITHGGGGRIFLKIPENLDVERWFAGTDWEFFQPIRINDTFRVWRSWPQLIDMTSPEDKNIRRFRIMSSDIKYINQKDEVVATFRRYFDETILPEPVYVNADVEIAPDYCYTDEEIEYIDRVAAEEEIRGSRILLWEDVQIGGELNPVIMGPITLRDLAIAFGCIAFDTTTRRVSRKEWQENGGMILDPLTNVLHDPIEPHLSDRVAQINGSTKACVASPVAESFLGRLITNWMGDDGFIRKFHWRMLAHTHLGDTITGKGKVIRKYIRNNEHLVDISLYTESLAEGEIHHAALATVKLMSEKEI